MKLLVDAHIFDSSITEGVSTHLKGLYTAVIQLSSPIEFYFVGHNVEKLKIIFGDYPHVHYIAYKSTNKYYRLAIELPQIIKNNKIDTAHFQYISPLLKCCKEIVTTHDILFRDFPQYFPHSYRFIKDIMFKHSARRADLLFTVSKYSKRAISKHYHIDPDQIFITPNAVSDDFFNASIEPLKEIKRKYDFDKYILCVSRIEPRKNHINLIKAYINLKLWKQNIKLVFVGKETVQTQIYHEYCNSLPEYIKSNIISIEQLSYEGLLSIYKGCTLFVYPSIAEGFGIPPIEAAASGVSCLCSNSTAMSDFNFFGDGFFDPNNVNELEQKMQHFFNNSLQTDTIRIQSIVRDKYNWNKVANYFLQTVILTGYRR